ncbi:unnamed protein product [Rhizophagus irregularis]|nr:unnamed protein product [Rhizophagus irregularis]
MKSYLSLLATIPSKLSFPCREFTTIQLQTSSIFDISVNDAGKGLSPPNRDELLLVRGGVATSGIKDAILPARIGVVASGTNDEIFLVHGEVTTSGTKNAILPARIGVVALGTNDKVLLVRGEVMASDVVNE